MKRLLLWVFLALAPIVALPASSVPPTAQLLSNASATGALTYWPGGIGAFVVTGTFGGATVTLEFLGPDGTTMMVAGSNTTMTAAGAGVFYLGQGYIQAVVSGGTPSALYASANLVQRF